MDARLYLRRSGVIMLVLGGLGLVSRVLGPTPAQSIFGATWYLDRAQGWSFLVAGAVALASSFIPRLRAGAARWVAIGLGIVAIVAGLYTFFLPELLGAHLENPADAAIYLVLGAWALAAALTKSNVQTA